MHLKCDRACANDLPSFSSGEAWRTDGIQSASRGRQGWITGQRRLSCGLACGIDAKNDVAVSPPIPNATDGFVGPPRGLAVLLEEGPKGFDTGTIDIGEIATQAGAMRQAFASKQGHESCCERC